MSISVLDTENLPTDIELLHSIIRNQSKENEAILKKSSEKYTALLLEIEELKARLNRQLNHRFGQRTEKQNQLMMFDDCPLFAGKADEIVDGDDEKDIEESTKPEKRKPKRVPINQNAELTETKETIQPPEEDLICDNCSGELKEFGQEKTTQYKYIPASIQAHTIVRAKFGCKKCDNGSVKIAELPSQPIPKSNADASLLSDILVSKFNDHLPLYRIANIYQRHGVTISRSTLSDWVMKCGILLAPIAEFMMKQILKSHHIFTDDTKVPLQNGKGALKKAILWVYLGDEGHPYCVFKHSPTRQGRYPQEILKEYTGYIHADAYTGYDAIFKPKIANHPHAYECSCWVHTRRYFANIIKTGPPLKEAKYAVKEIAKLYKIESESKDFSNEDRRLYRLEHSKPIIDEFGHWLDAHKDFNQHSDFKKAVTYARNQWNALQTFLEDGRLSMDNNKSEQAIRPIAVGRKNWLFAGSDGAAKNAAVIQSLVATCKIHEVNPYAYFNDALLIMAEARDTGNTEKAAGFTPLAWKQFKENAEKIES
jgi:transposase